MVVGQELPSETMRMMPVSLVWYIYLSSDLLCLPLIPNYNNGYLNFAKKCCIVWIDDGKGGRASGSGKPKKPEPKKPEAKKGGGFKFPWDK